MSADKRAIRQILREGRRGLSVAVVESAGAAVCAQILTFAPYQTAVSVIAYVADENEIPTARLLDEVVRSGRIVYLPCHTPEPALIAWRPGERLSAGAGGILEPAGCRPAHPEPPAIAFLPVVAWDETGTRLGRGGGFYDRVFAQLAAGIVRVGLAYELQRWPELPREPWDVPLHYVITEQRIVRCTRPEAVQPALLQKGGLHW